MQRFLLVLAALVLFCSHDMFLRLDSYYLDANSDATIKLYNGTFEHSENVIDRDRMADVSLLYGGTRTVVDTSSWSERDSMTILSFQTGDPGNYVAGVSTHSREIAMTAKDFNDYLEHEGGQDMLVLRKREKTLDQDAVERYSKHVKAIFQVGEERTTDWQTPFGYPVEFVPQSNPYNLHAGEVLSVKLLKDGQALANQVVLLGNTSNQNQALSKDHNHEHSHTDGERHSHAHEEGHDHVESHAASATHDHEHSHTDGERHRHAHEEGHDHVESHNGTGHSHDIGTQLRTDENGLIEVPITHDGIWHMRTIHLITVDEPTVTHESNWATLTFEVSHDQPHTHDDHTHEHTHEGGIPSYAYWMVSLAVIGLLFLIFNSKR